MPTSGALRRSNRLAMKSGEEIQSPRVPGNSGEPADRPPASRGNGGDGGPSRGRGRGRGRVRGRGRGRGRGDGGGHGSAADPTSIPAARGSGTELTSNLIKPTASRSKDAPLSQSINAEADSSRVKSRAKTLGSTLADKFLLAGKNDEGEIFQNLFNKLAVPKDKNSWNWVYQLPEWTAFINVKAKANEEEFKILLRAFLKDDRVKRLFEKKPKTFVFSGAQPLKTSYGEYDRGGKGNDMKPDIFSALKPHPYTRQIVDNDATFSWKDVEVIWELKSNKNEINNKLIIFQTAIKATEALRVQWGRRFVIVVLACGTSWRLCWFDRAGGTTHYPFDIAACPQLFACCVLFPLLLPQRELGMADMSTITVNNQVFDLGSHIFRPHTDRLVSRGTSVCRAKLSDTEPWALCAKSSWHYRDRNIELDTLKALQHIPGVVKLVGGQTMTVDDKEDSISNCRLNMPMQQALFTLKRPPESSHYDEFASVTKKTRLDGPAIKGLGSSQAAPTELPPPLTNISVYDKVHVVLILKEAGLRYDAHEHTPLQKMECLRQVLKTLRDVRDEGWLHRDISPANITIPGEGTKYPAGVVIDWDMARKVVGADEGAQERTGTAWYMAIGILQEQDMLPIHHVLHDVESVFWVCFLDALKRSGTEKGKAWLEVLSHSTQISQIYDSKGMAFTNPRKFENCFTEEYSIMWKLLKGWRLRLLKTIYKDSPEIPQYDYEDQDYGEIFDDLDKLFVTYIAEEKGRRGDAATRATDDIDGVGELLDRPRESEPPPLSNLPSGAVRMAAECAIGPPGSAAEPQS